MAESQLPPAEVDPEFDPPKRSSTIFGRDISMIPCFRSSFLYGISFGIGVGFLAFLKTSRPQLSTHIGFGTFMATTIGYWFPCRYAWSKQKFDMAQLQEALKQQALYEGTEKERELDVKLGHA
ncbi:cytochrome c oxidase assembly protein COX20, mitochondrial [Anopheles cruzii]|uniref:cytochrome c oxidase assembly protein COX20, mitochondrial n=1 Tax=Anopheles cruzii TaxID=68878 RepID=UPI0022EC3A61|nr:cytochrome c oxidase assembly protein COX20, mitochondrial [Anopheles cruzii]